MKENNRNNGFRRQVHESEKRKLHARQQANRTIWFGFGMFGMVGWAVAVPMVAGTLVGVWIDLTWPSRFSWTLMLLAAGLALGCYNAWYWIQKERQAIIGSKEKNHEQ